MKPVNRKPWAPRPKEQYVREYNGLLLGIGAHPAIVSEVMWDLIWLVTPPHILNAYDEGGPVENLAMSDYSTPAIIGSCYQHITDTELLGGCAARMKSPDEFLSFIESQPLFDSLFLTTALGRDWVNQTRAEEFKVFGDNVLVGNFGG